MSIGWFEGLKSRYLPVLIGEYGNLEESPHFVVVSGSLLLYAFYMKNRGYELYAES